MKRILFVSSFKGVGGTEISLLNLLKQLNKDQVQVDLALIGEQGPLTSKIPEWVRVISIENKSTKEYIRSMAKGGKPFKALQGIIRHFRLKSEWSRSKLDTMRHFDHMLYLYPRIEEEYDVAITWYVPDSIYTVYTLKNTNAKRKVMWIHMDVSMYYMPEDSEAVLQSYDKIYCVSKACKNSFDKKYIGCMSKTEVYYNVIDELSLIKAGQIPVENIKKDSFNIVTSGRISPEKQPLLIVEAAEKLVSYGIRNFRWYIIGDGVLRREMEEAIKKKDLGEYFVIMGRLDNPFSYIAKCDLYVQASLHESFCLSLAEAQILGVPSISTNFPSAYEIIKSEKNGIIVANSCEKIADAIKLLITDHVIYSKMKKELKNNALLCLGSAQQLMTFVNGEN